ncbi:MAG: hypothetical protein FJ130_07455 [Deltaproteobacteria bacterium]|nr:hypothetical protein [Deltaproteobacteria bacterium]
MKYLSKTETTSIPQRLPFITLKDTIIFPCVGVPLFLQSEDALTVLNKSVMENSLMGCAYQRASLPKDPQPKEILSVGTVCRILQLVRLPNRGMKVFVEGISRVFIRNIVQETPYFRADVMEVVEPEEKSLLSGTLVQSIGTLFKISLSAGRPLPDEALKTLDQIEHPGQCSLAGGPGKFLSGMGYPHPHPGGSNPERRAFGRNCHCHGCPLSFEREAGSPRCCHDRRADIERQGVAGGRDKREDPGRPESRSEDHYPS